MSVTVAPDTLLAKIAKPIAPKGVYAAVLSPFDDKYEIDTPLLIDHAKWLLANGCNGLSTTGSTGEGNSMPTKQRIGLLDTLLKAGVPADKMIPGTGAASLGDVVELTRHAVQAGCGGALVLPPYYYSNPTEDGLFAAFASLIERVADSRLRLYLYHIPQFTGVPIPYAVIDRLIDAFPGIIAGLKDSFGDWSYSENLLKHLPGFAVYPGSEIFLSRVKKAGGGGCISGTVNFTAPLAAQVYAAATEAEAERLQTKLDAVRKVVEAHPLVPALKAIKGEMVGKPSWGRVLPPFTQLPDAARTDLFKALDGFLSKSASGHGWELRA
ncbi:MAG TPA: dihydrodipicolinate synthase family protein [Magnetospirillaceae bacterium]|jgi:4-hydroxy-tetrahydrodipicolinate synthase